MLQLPGVVKILLPPGQGLLRLRRRHRHILRHGQIIEVAIVAHRQLHNVHLIIIILRIIHREHVVRLTLIRSLVVLRGLHRILIPHHHEVRTVVIIVLRLRHALAQRLLIPLHQGVQVAGVVPTALRREVRHHLLLDHHLVQVLREGDKEQRAVLLISNTTQ